MKRWALVVVALYLLILVVLTVPVILLTFAPAVFFLYVERWRRLHPEPQPEA